MAEIATSILRQIQPCANRQITPGPGAEHIKVAVRLHLNRDGSLAEPPRIMGHSGIDDLNSRYVAQVDAEAISAFTHCAPLHGLPADLYDGPAGWARLTMLYKLPG